MTESTIKKYRIFASDETMEGICKALGVDPNYCAEITLHMLPREPIVATVVLLADERIEKIEWRDVLENVSVGE